MRRGPTPMPEWGRPGLTLRVSLEDLEPAPSQVRAAPMGKSFSVRGTATYR